MYVEVAGGKMWHFPSSQFRMDPDYISWIHMPPSPPFPRRSLNTGVGVQDKRAIQMNRYSKERSGNMKGSNSSTKRKCNADIEQTCEMRRKSA